ncbi:hypothetical protein DPMN_130488 [Dreissena polymorpha]|uniref:CCHC-type domain-containing protein n=1 Tax=Dreissena polymorpha TaxID=45954 RepID=A0A9D4H6U3_DREPO|nr:hypothetical protein DPMN_130488 [Dreissena polymorpha]
MVIQVAKFIKMAVNSGTNLSITQRDLTGQGHMSVCEYTLSMVERIGGCRQPDKTHPHRDIRTREEDLVRRFLGGLLYEDTRFEVEYHKEPATIDEAVYNVVTRVQTRGGTECEKGYRRSAGRTTESEKPYAGDQVAPKKPSTYSRAKKWPKSPKQDTTYDSGEILKRLDNLEGSAMKSSGKKRSRKDIECYRCHGKGHFARECLSGEKKGEVVHTEPNFGESNLPLNETGPATVAKGRSKLERPRQLDDGVYIKGKENNIPVIFTTDTGASRTIVSKRGFDQLVQANRPVLRKTACLIRAGGAPIKKEDREDRQGFAESFESDDSDLQADYVVEPTENFKERYPLQMASTRVNINQSPTCVIRLLNPFTTEVKLCQDAVIGSAEKIERVVSVLSSKKND